MHPFGAAAVKLGFVTPTQVAECLALEDERLKVGDARTLPEILQEKGYLAAAQARAVFDAMGVPPHIIAGYELLAPIGRGGMGEVYRARQVKMNRVVAIKFLSDELAADADYVKRFFAEARTAAQFNHRNLVAAYDAGAVDGRVYFVMEYVEGRSLRDAVEKHGPLPERQAVLAAASIVEALHALEQRGTVHRDVKPENVMIDGAGVVKLCDFGLARARGKTAGGTTGAAIVGTPHYMPPEQIRGDALDIRADFYALGATLFTLTTGRHPFEGDDVMAVIAKHLTDPPPDVRAVTLSLSTGFAKLVARLMAKAREARPANCADLLRELRALADPTPAPRPPTSRRAAARYKPARSRAPWVAGAIAVAVVAVGLVIVMRPPPSAAPAPAPPPAPPVADSPVEDEAAKLLAEADANFDGRRWEDAKLRYDRFTHRYRETKAFRARPSYAAERAAACETAGAAELAVVEAEMKAGRWESARAAIAKAQPTARLRDLDRTCESELQGARRVSDVEAARSAKRWADVVRLCEGVSDLRAAATEARAELAAEAVLRDLRAAVAAGDWPAVRASAQKMRSEHGSSATYRDHERTVHEAVERAVAALKQSREAEAKRLSEQAAELAEAKKWDEAIDKLRTLEHEYADTDFARESARAIVDRRLACERGRDARREKDAEDLHRAALAHVRAKSYDDARASLAKLLADFAATIYVRSREKDLRKALDELPSFETLDDFERPGGYGGLAEKMDPPVVKDVDGAREGERCLRVTFAKRTAEDLAAKPSVSGRHSLLYVRARPPQETAGIVFWARHDGRGSARVSAGLLAVGADPKKNWAMYCATIDLTSEWKEYALSLADFKPFDGVGDLAAGKLDVSAVQGFVVLVAEPNRDVSVLLDDLRARVVRK